MDTLKGSIEMAVQSIDLTTNKFYQNKTQEGFTLLKDTIDLITNMLNEINIYKQQGHGIEIEETKISKVLTEAMKALEKRDVLLLSDILQYDLKELLELVQSEL